MLLPQVSNQNLGKITLNFKGLMAACEKKERGQFEFLCHGESDGERSHKLAVRADGLPLPEAAGAREIEFFVADKETGQPKEGKLSACKADASGERSFSNVLDIESAYGMELQKAEPANFSNLITVKSGEIYTSKLSGPEFVLVDSEGKKLIDPRRVSLELGIDVFLEEDEIGILRWADSSGQGHSETFSSDKFHYILFDNDCHSDAAETESDFYLNFENIIHDPRILQCDLVEYANTYSGPYNCNIIWFGFTNGWEKFIESLFYKWKD